MKMNRFIKHGSCLSLMAMLPTMFGPSLMTQPVEAQTAGVSSLVSTDPDDILFWAMAWGISYTSNQYMLMEPSSPDSTLLTVKLVADSGLDYTDPNLTVQDVQSQNVAQGTFDISSWYQLGKASVSSNDPVNGGTNTLTTGLYAIAGNFTGSTGFQTPVYGLATRLHAVIEGAVGQEASFYSFLPEGFNLSAPDADSWALDMFNSVQAGQAPRGKRDVVQVLTALQLTGDPDSAMASVLDFTNLPFLDGKINDLSVGGGVQTEEAWWLIPILIVLVWADGVGGCQNTFFGCRDVAVTEAAYCDDQCNAQYLIHNDLQRYFDCTDCCEAAYTEDADICRKSCGSILPDPRHYGWCYE